MKYCYREANKYANVLARMGANQANDFFLFKCPPVDILETLSPDGNGLYLTRWDAASFFPTLLGEHWGRCS